ncbi:hypothetical protein ACQP2F_13475 [Actinoplanes sp. CA-030573]|uniref:TY-Chap2 family putative peptide chaperone n=1 Tax=Actinoplanes sp. CA-030573 TaxID=3239898 RepID=UPI003D8FD9B0
MRCVRRQMWSLVSMLLRRHPGLQVAETQHGIALFKPDDDARFLLIDRDGDLVIAADRPWPTLDELLAAAPDGEKLTDLEYAVGLEPPPMTPPSTPAVLAYRTLALLMAITLDDKREWQIRGVWQETISGAHHIKAFLVPFPVAAARAETNRTHESYRRSYLPYWAVLRAGEPVALVDTYGFVHVGSQVFSLPELYTAHARRLTPTVAAALGEVLP